MKVGERITKPLGQSSARWQVLGRADAPLQTVSQMARDMGLARQSVQRVANDLRRDGLVTFVELAGDRRTSLVKLTPAGHKVLGEIYARNSEWAERMSERISAKEFENAIELLEKIGKILEEKSDG